jgi:cytochrome c1
MIKSILFALFLFPLTSMASEAKLDMSDIPTDHAAVLRGAELTVTICGSCHGLKFVKYINLRELGVSLETVDSWRGTNSMDATIPAQMPEDATMSAFGVVPPDLSMIAKSREGDEHYVYSYLMGYGVGQNGQTTNRIYPITRMPDPLGISGATDEKQRSEIAGQARDISAFLAWAADPHAQERRTMGYYVLAYLFVLTGLLYLIKRRVWAKIDKLEPI